jgi:hypothetical protein
VPSLCNMKKTRLGVILVAWLCALAAACSQAGEEDGHDQQSSQAGAAISFCEEYFSATCQQLWRCGCNQQALEVCEYQIETCGAAGFFLSLEEGIEKGWLRYDPNRARTLLARMTDAQEACDHEFVVLGFDSVSGHTFGGVFAGTLGAGSECGDDPDVKALPGVTYCREGLLCLPGADHVNRCAPIAALGEACPIVPSDPGSSCFERQPADPDGTLTSGQIDLVCVPDAPGSQTGTCQRDAPDGTVCANHAQCASGFCLTSEPGELLPGTCAGRLANGELCFDPGACVSGRCDFSVDPPSCAEPSPDGGACLFAEDCASENCAPAEDDELFGTCHEATSSSPLPVGTECGPQDACAGGICGDGVCLQPICTAYNL